MKLASGLVALFMGLPLEVSAQAPAGSGGLEQALSEHACRTLQGEASEEAYQECLDARLLELRGDFGRDLSRLTVAERNTLDAACSATRAAKGRTVYLECLTVQLRFLHKRRSGTDAGSAPATPFLASGAVPVVAQAVAVPEATSGLVGVRLAGMLIVMVVAAGGAVMAARALRPRPKCRSCGGEVPEAGDLCPQCRHEAADALRRATTERAELERAEAEGRRRETERQEEEQRRKAREVEEVHLRYQQEERQREENARRRELEEEESRKRNRIAGNDVPSGETFDPFAILGLPPDAGREAIDEAYQRATLKYAPDQVADLGYELQEHYKRKAEAANRAYKMLTA